MLHTVPKKIILDVPICSSYQHCSWKNFTHLKWIHLTIYSRINSFPHCIDYATHKQIIFPERFCSTISTLDWSRNSIMNLSEFIHQNCAMLNVSPHITTVRWYSSRLYQITHVVYDRAPAFHSSELLECTLIQFHQASLASSKESCASSTQFDFSFKLLKLLWL